MQQCVGVQVPMPAPASGQSPFGFVSGNSLRLLPKTALTSLPLLPNPKHLASDLFFLLRATYRLRRRFFVPNKRHRALTPLLLLSKLNPLRWASIWGFSFSRTSYRSRRRFFVPNKRHLSFTPSLLLSKLNPLRWASIWVLFFSKSAQLRFLAPPSKSEALGFGFVFYYLADFISLAHSPNWNRFVGLQFGGFSGVMGWAGGGIAAMWLTWRNRK